jgi:ferrous iron transport protein B
LRHAHPTARDRWTALKLLEYDDSHVDHLSAELLQQVSEQRHRIHQVLGEDIDIAVADSRYGYAHRLVNDIATRPREVSLTQSDKIDQIVLNRWLGIPIFLGVMYLLFMFAINVGSAFIDFFDILFGTIFVDGLGHVLAAMGMPDLVQVVLADGMGGGIQTVATFIPGDCLSVPVHGLFGRQRLHGPRRLRDGSLYAVCRSAGEILCAHAGGLWL